MKTIILFTQNDFYKVDGKNMMNMYSSAMSKWLKIFRNLSERMNLKMYAFRPKSYANQRPHGTDITLVNEDQLKDMSFDYAYINKDTGLEIFNKANPTILSKTYLFNESHRFNNDLSKVDIYGHCSVNSYIHKKVPNVLNILAPNICNGNKITPKKVVRKDKVVFIGRYSDKIIPKVIFLAKEFPNVQFDIYATKFWDVHNSKWVGFGPHQKDRVGARKIFRRNNPPKNIKLKDPIQHNVLYETMQDEGYKIGFAPSILPMNKRHVPYQVNSSSKFYDYIGSGIPVLAENLIPEADFVRKNPGIGRIYKNETLASLKNVFSKMLNDKFAYGKIIRYAQDNHYPEHRVDVILKELK